MLLLVCLVMQVIPLAIGAGNQNNDEIERYTIDSHCLLEIILFGRATYTNYLKMKWVHPKWSL